MAALDWSNRIVQRANRGGGRLLVRLAGDSSARGATRLSLGEISRHSVHDSQRALVLAKPIDEEVAQRYLDKVRQTRGEEAWREAERDVKESGSGGTDYQRVLAHSHLGPNKLPRHPLHALSGSRCGATILTLCANSL